MSEGNTRDLFNYVHLNINGIATNVAVYLDHTERNSGDEHQRGYDWNNVEHIRESIGTA